MNQDQKDTKNDSKKGHFYFNGEGLYKLAMEMHRVLNLRRAHFRCGVGYPCLLSYTKPLSLDAPQNQVLERIFNVLVNGLGYTPTELASLKLVDVFPIIFENPDFKNNGDDEMLALVGDLAALRQQMGTELLATGSEDE